MENKIIIMLIENPFCKRDYDRFGVELLQANGFIVRIWNLAPFLQNEFFCKTKVVDPVSFDGYKEYRNFNEVKSAILALENDCFVISFVSYRFETFNIFKAISKRKLSYCIYAAGRSFPCACESEKRILSPVSFRKQMYKILNKFKKIVNLDSVMRYLFRHTYFSLLGISPAEIVLAGGAKTNFSFIPIGSKTKILWLHYLDFDIYLEEKKRPLAQENNFGVFLDDYLPFHSDWTAWKRSPPITAEDYYPSLCRFFDYLENNLGVKIIIAAHPRSAYENHRDYFGGRTVIRGQTANLVRNSNFVVACASYSVNFVVLFKKPIIFVTTDIINQTAHETLIDANKIAGLFGKKAINLNRPFNFNYREELLFDEEKYSQYKHFYIKKNETRELPFWQMVADYIKSEETNNENVKK